MKRLVAFVLCLQSFGLSADTIDLRSGDSVCKVDAEHGARIVSWTVERWAEIGAPLYGGLPDDAWRHILSIEPSTSGMKDAKPLQPGESKVLTAQISKAYSL